MIGRLILSAQLLMAIEEVWISNFEIQTINAWQALLIASDRALCSSPDFGRLGACANSPIETRSNGFFGLRRAGSLGEHKAGAWTEFYSNFKFLLIWNWFSINSLCVGLHSACRLTYFHLDWRTPGDSLNDLPNDRLMIAVPLDANGWYSLDSRWIVAG